MPTAAPAPPSCLHRPFTSAGRGLSLHVTTRGAERDVRADGRLVAGAGATHPMWAALARELGRDLVIDLSGVTAIDAAGVGRLLNTRQRLGARGARLTLTRHSPDVRRVLDIVGLSAALLAPDTAPASAATPPRTVFETELSACGC